MPKLAVDLTAVNLVPEGNHEALITDVKYQVKTGEKWNNEGTTTVSFEDWLPYPLEKRRIHLTLQPQTPGVNQFLWHDLYMIPTAAGFVKDWVRAAGVYFDKDGYDPDEFAGKTVGVSVIIKEETPGMQRNEITKVYKV